MYKFMRIAILLFASLALIRLLSPPLDSHASCSQAIYDRNGNLLRLTLSRDEKFRLWLPLKDISPVLVQTTLLHEDRWFRFHPGVSPAALVRAVWHTYIRKDRVVGGSTITMQLARLRYDINSRTIPGKLKQMLAAFWLELLYSKTEIIEAYLNLAPYGLNIEGAGAASLIYFHKNADNLTLAEALTLSVIPQSPARRMRSRSNEGDTDQRSLEQARAVLFAKWVKRNPHDSDKRPLIGLPILLKRPPELPFLSPHFTNEVLGTDPLEPVLHTTLDSRLQGLIERHVRNHIRLNRQKGVWNAVALLADHRTLEVKALIGSADFFDAKIDGQVNGARAKRSPGSALKPFIYGLGIDQGLIHPLTMLKDAPMSFGSYNPENFDNDFIGPIKAKDALVKSRNVPAVDVASRLASPGLHGFLLNAGITRMREVSHYGMSLALGSAEVSLEELVTLYAMLANQGELRPLKFVKGRREEEGRSLLSREASFLVLDMLASNPPPDQAYRSAWVRDPISISWKTGTSFGFRDAWSIGIAGPYVLGIWVGNFNGEGNPAFIGREAAAPLLFEIIDSLRAQNQEIKAYRSRGLADLNLTKVNVCALSGGILGSACPHRAETWFIPGTSPIAKCDVHRKISVHRRTGLRACSEHAPGTRSEVYEFWQSDLLEVFRQAGITRRVPPPYEPGCRMDVTASQGASPKITSPREQVVYSLRAANLSAERIPLTAVTDADVRTVRWFVNEEYLGETVSGRPYFWGPRSGSFAIRAVDDHGRAAVREIRVSIVE